MTTIKIVRIWKGENGINIMLNTADCVYFHRFGKTIYTELPDNLQKKDFAEFKADITTHNWDVEKLKEIWINKK